MGAHTNMYILLHMGSTDLLRGVFNIANLSDIFPPQITEKYRGEAPIQCFMLLERIDLVSKL